MASQSFGPSVTTSSGSTLTLYYDNIEVSGDGASARITNPRAQFTYKSGWSDSTNNFSTIGTNAVAGANHGAQSLSGGATKTFYSTSNWVALNYNGETTVQYTFRVSNVSFFTGDSSTRDYTMNINLPRRVSTVGSLNGISTFNMGATVPISWTRPDPNSTVTVSVAFGGWMTTLVNRTTATSTNWASSLATLAARVPNATSGTGTVYADYFDINGNYVGASAQSFTANVPSSVVPTAGTFSVAEGNAAVLAAFGTATNTFIQNKSQIKGTAGTGGAGVYGSTITKTELLINGSVAATFSGHGAGATATTPVITHGWNVYIAKRVTDSRGRTATTSEITGTIRPYSAPSISSLEAFRSTSGGDPSGSSTQVTVQLGASVSSLLNGSTQKNTLKYVVKYKLSTGATYTTEFTSALPAGTLTTSPTGNGRRIIPSAVVFNIGSVYDIQVEVTDVFGGTPQTKNAVVSTEIVPLSISDVGIGVGKVWQKGSIDAKDEIYQQDLTVPPTGTVVAFAGLVAPTGWLLCDGAEVSRTTYARLFALIGTTYGSGSGGTTFKIPNLKGRVIAGFDADQWEFYPMGWKWGSTTHTLSIDEMPSHRHDLTMSTTPHTGSSSTRPLQGNLPTSNVTPNDMGFTGGDKAHNNLQPYIVMQYIIKT